MKKVIKASERGKTKIDWLESYHTFSFGEFYNPNQMGYKSLRVLNDDRVAAGKGFGMHPHRNMEIFSYVPEGTLEHKDSLGNNGIVGKGRVQLMSAGTGIFHSEFNPSREETTHLIQIWIEPLQNNTSPSYQERELLQTDAGIQLLFSPDGKDNSMQIKQNAWLYDIHPGENQLNLPTPDQSQSSEGFLYIVEGSIIWNGQTYEQGDSIVTNPTDIKSLNKDTDLLWFVFQ